MQSPPGIVTKLLRAPRVSATLPSSNKLTDADISAQRTITRNRPTSAGLAFAIVGLNLWAIDANEINDVEKPLEAVAADTAAAEAKAERLFKAQEAFDKLSDRQRAGLRWSELLRL